MIIYDKGRLDRIGSWSDETIHVLTDFDRTITMSSSHSSWDIFSKYGLTPSEYVEEEVKMYDYYRPLELDESLEHNEKCKLMMEWWIKNIDLIVKYQLPEAIVDEAINDVDIMEFRTGAKEFLKNMYQRNIPVVIISAGIGNFIEQFLIKNNCCFDNIFIVANFLKFENEVAVGIEGDVVHSLNKNEASLPAVVSEIIKDRPNIILLGDFIGDIKMAPLTSRENALKIGFLDVLVDENLELFKKNFDVVCTGNTSYTDLANEIEVLRRLG